MFATGDGIVRVWRHDVPAVFRKKETQHPGQPASTDLARTSFDPDTSARRLPLVGVVLFLFVSFEGEPLDPPPRFSSPWRGADSFFGAARAHFWRGAGSFLARRGLISAMSGLILALREIGPPSKALSRSARVSQAA